MKKDNRKAQFIKTICENLKGMNQAGINKTEQAQGSSPILPRQSFKKAKETVVIFDKATSPFEVAFSERGFEINKTRLSFEFIETALSKDANIVLNKGNGLVLDSVKMEKILKYKDLYSRQNVNRI